MQLISDIDNYPRFWSVQLGSAAAILSAIEIALPHFEQHLPQPWFGIVSFVCMVGALVVRGIAQPGLRQPDPPVLPGSR